MDEPAPLDGVVAGAWRDAVLETDGQGRQRVNRITYEICVLEALRERLRCREIWVVGADRYRNPDQDLPADFEVNRDAHYAALGLPRDGETFIARVCADMVEALETLDRGLAENPHLRILKRGGGRIALAPLEKQEEPEGLIALKTEIGQRWPMTNLLDMLKEADLRIGFTDAFHTVTDHENLSRAVLQERLLLCLHGLGTNTGLKRMAAGQPAITYKDLLYVRRRFIIREHLREAVARVVNATLRVRRPLIWGDGTTACAADAKQFGAWDQNLMTEWHARYGGRGVMIYWHVERKSTCIYSQLKTCSSSEVAAMIEGVLRHCTEMEVEKTYVDSHGQSAVAFAFCSLLGFALLPRLKRIHAQKLSRPAAGAPECLPGAEAGHEPADQLAADRPAVRRDGQVRDRAPARHGGRRGHPAPLHAQQHPAPDLSGTGRARQGAANRLSSLAICTAWPFAAKSTRASTSSSTGTAPTTSSSTVAAARSPPTGSTTRRSPC